MQQALGLHWGSEKWVHRPRQATSLYSSSNQEVNELGAWCLVRYDGPDVALKDQSLILAGSHMLMTLRESVLQIRRLVMKVKRLIKNYNFLWSCIDSI